MIEKGLMKETGKCIAELREEEDALEGIKCRNDSGHKVGPLLSEKQRVVILGEDE